MASLGSSDVAEWYRDRTIFITGGTGFMGKVLVEKLLRSCPVKRIYLLMRPKKGVDVRQRVEDMFNFKVSLDSRFSYYIIHFLLLLLAIPNSPVQQLFLSSKQISFCMFSYSLYLSYKTKK